MVVLWREENVLCLKRHAHQCYARVQCSIADVSIKESHAHSANTTVIQKLALGQNTIAQQQSGIVREHGRNARIKSVDIHD